MGLPNFDDVRSPKPTQTALMEIVQMAQCESYVVFRDKTHAAWQEEAGAWQRLADAAYACESILVRRQLSFVQGIPPAKEPPNDHA